MNKMTASYLYVGISDDALINDATCYDDYGMHWKAIRCLAEVARRNGLDIDLNPSRSIDEIRVELNHALNPKGIMKVEPYL